MECLSQMWSIVPCLWECSSKHAAYIRHLEDNLNLLRNAMDSLDNLSQDVRNRVRDAQQQHRRLRNQVTGWLRRVEALVKRVNPVLAMGTREVENKCIGSCCPKNCWSSYKLGKKVVRMIPEVRGLIDEGRFDDVADDDLVAAPVDEMPMEGPVVGFESKFEEIWQSVRDKDSSIIGLVGIGGVGKTTLLKQLNNELSKIILEFDLVIWIVVSQSPDLGEIRNIIRSKLNIPDHLWGNRSKDQRISLIFKKLQNRKFVVLLDDIWERLELSEVGIPPPCGENMSKVVFTTRSLEVCQCMDAQKIVKVSCLPTNEALSLFYSKFGEDVLKFHEEIRELVKDVAKECQGLPLALITIARSMRGKVNAQQWKDAKRALQKYPSNFLGMKSGVFSKLVFSYDNLPSPTLQKCFEYCSIFPDDHEIRKEELIRLWIAEGLIDEYGDVYDALIQGRQIVEGLVQACLLEVSGEKEEIFTMHDVIRDMALWLACERGEKKNKFLSGGDHNLPTTTQWRNAEKASLWGNGITAKSLVGLSFCSNLVTLIIRSTDNLKVLPVEMFHSMNVLRVLDLSYNRGLNELPTEIGSLINLEYLNIIFTRVARLPVEVEQLKKLRFLLLNDMTLIPRGVISNLCSLQTFEQNVFGKVGRFDDEAKMRLRKSGREMLGELEGREQIMDLSLVVRDVETIQILLDSPKLQSCTRQLQLFDCESLPAVLDLCRDGMLMDHLETLYLDNCDMSAVKFGPSSSSLGNLRHVSIWNCPKVRNVSSLVYVRSLCTLFVGSCESMIDLIGEESKTADDFDDIGSFLFSSLTSLTVWNLPNLRSICPHAALPFPSLKMMIVDHCPILRKLPFGSNTAKTTRPELKIKGSKMWWDYVVEWESQETKDAFTSKFQPNPEEEISRLNLSKTPRSTMLAATASSIGSAFVAALIGSARRRRLGRFSSTSPSPAKLTIPDL